MTATPFIVQLDPAAAIANRAMLDLNSGPIRVGGSAGGGSGIDWGQAAITAYQTQEGQYGNGVADYVIPNRIVTIQLGLGMDESGTQESVREQLQQKVALLQREGGVLLRQRPGGQPMYADIMNATLTLPDVWGETGDIEPDVQLVLECIPDFYGDEITLDAITGTGEVVGVLQKSGAQAAISGDYPARCRILVTDTSGHAQEGVLWGLRSRHHSAAATAALSYRAQDLLRTGGATVTALAGSYSGSVVTLSGPPNYYQSMLVLSESSGSAFTHVGTYNVWVRCYVAAGGASPFASLQLQWGPGVGPSLITNEPVTIPGSGQFFVLSLGVVTIAAVPVGAQQWYGVIQATSTTGSPSVSLDKVWLQPLDEAAGQVLGSDPPTAVVDANDVTEVRSEGAFVGSSGVYSPANVMVGDLPRIPPSGMEGRAAELFVKPSRGQFGAGPTPNDPGIDSLKAQVIYRPCWLSRP